MGVSTRASDFFVAGGTLHPDSPSYVKRPADDELFNLALAGEFCYVLTARQMGKSSIMVRTAEGLTEHGVHTVIIDLTSIGTDISAEQWYLGLITRIQAQLKLPVDPEAWWAERASLGAVQCFTDFLHDVVLTEIEGPVVVFVDEVDTTLNLDFSDDFFAAVRFIYNARAADGVYNRLTFVLLGVAAPADLIKDPSRTPFNIGHRVDLHEFSQEDAQVLQKGLEAICQERGKAIFARIYHWTNGHPYLTQKLCLAIAEAGDGRWTEMHVDRLVESLFLSEQARKETNLQFVRNKILTHTQHRQLLALYRKVYKGRRLSDDERSPIQSQLKLSGLVKAEDGYLRIRNEIYRRAFDLAWVRENTPIKWAPIATGIAALVALLAAALVALLAVGAILYNAWVGIQFQDCYASFYQTDVPEERLAHLATIFKLRGLLGSTDYDHRARELFHGLSREEQLVLFSVADVEESDLIVVIGGLYITLADVNGTNSTEPVLEAMARTLSRLDGTQKVIDLRDEIDSWRRGRELARQNLYPEALEAYNKAVALNGENPATLYERARVLTKLTRYEQALGDLDQVMAIAKRAPVPTPTPLPTSTSVPTTISVAPESTLTVGAHIPPVRTSAPGADVSLIQTPAPDAGISPIQTPASATLTAIPTLSPDLTQTPIPTATPEGVPIPSEFVTLGEIARAIRMLIHSNSGLVDALARATGAEYPTLREFGLVPTPTMFPEVASDLAAETEMLLETTTIPVRDLHELAIRFKGLPPDTPRVVGTTSPDYPVGTRRLFRSVSNEETGEVFDLHAILQHKTQHVYMWVEEGTDFNIGDLRAAADLFEEHIYPTTRAFFGSEWTPGVDGDPHISILHARNLGSSTSGYYACYDELVSEVRDDSNEMEMFTINLDTVTINSDYYNSTLAFNLQTMIHWHNDPDEETWLNLGFSELASYLNGFDPGGHEQVFAMEPDTQLNSWPEDLSTAARYGAGYLFTSYFLDRFGEETTRALAAHPDNGIASVNAILGDLGAGLTFDDLFADWVVANLLDDPSIADGRYGYEEINLPSFDIESTYYEFDYPVSESATVHQQGTDYIELHGDQPLRFSFIGSSQVSLVDTVAHSGQYLWWSNRGDERDTTLTHAFDLSGVNSATLQFWTWYDIEENRDYAYVEASTDGGQTWDILTTPSGTGANPNGESFGWAYNGLSGSGPRWTQEEIDLSPYVGREILLRFEYITEISVAHPGFLVDDIAIPEIGFFDDCEASMGGWEAAGFIRHANVLPQRWLVQLILLGLKTTVQRLELDEDQTDQWIIPLEGDVRRAIIAISALAPVTTETASYRYEITATP